MEARKQDGKPYPLNTLYQLCCGLLRHIRTTQLGWNIFTDVEFIDFQKMLDAQMKKVLSCWNSARPLFDEWGNVLSGRHNQLHSSSQLKKLTEVLSLVQEKWSFLISRTHGQMTIGRWECVHYICCCTNLPYLHHPCKECLKHLKTVDFQFHNSSSSLDLEKSVKKQPKAGNAFERLAVQLYTHCLQLNAKFLLNQMSLRHLWKHCMRESVPCIAAKKNAVPCFHVGRPPGQVRPRFSN